MESNTNSCCSVKVRACHRESVLSQKVLLVDLRMGNAGRSSPGLCISRHGRTEHWHRRQERDREGNGSGPCAALGRSWRTGDLSSGKRRTVYRGWEAGQRAGVPGREDPGKASPQVPIVTHRPRFCVQSRIPTFHGNFKPVEFVASDFFLDSQFRVSLTIFLKTLSSWLLRLLLALSVYDSSWFSPERPWQDSRYCPCLLTWQKEPKTTRKSEDRWAQELV